MVVDSGSIRPYKWRVMMAETDTVGRWGTWEELLLGGAVLRHGTQDWDVVASELRTRLVCSYTLTPEVMQKFEEKKGAKKEKNTLLSFYLIPLN